jgi:hypothetical protein
MFPRPIIAKGDLQVLPISVRSPTDGLGVLPISVRPPRRSSPRGAWGFYRYRYVPQTDPRQGVLGGSTDIGTSPQTILAKGCLGVLPISVRPLDRSSSSGPWRVLPISVHSPRRSEQPACSRFTDAPTSQASEAPMFLATDDYRRH